MAGPLNALSHISSGSGGGCVPGLHSMQYLPGNDPKLWHGNVLIVLIVAGCLQCPNRSLEFVYLSDELSILLCQF